MDENPELPAFQPCTILFRALPYPEWVRKSDGKHKHQTFMLRPNEGGLSLFTNIEACKAHFAQPIFGIRSVQVRALREYGLEVFPDEPNHVNIRQSDGQNIPNKSLNPPAALQVADDLMDRSRPVGYWNEPNADDLFARELEAKREARRAAGQ